MRKKIAVLSFLFIFVPVIVLPQTKEEGKYQEPTTKLEAFLAKKGELIVKEFYRLGGITGSYGAKVQLSALVIYEPGRETERIRGLKIEVTEEGTYENSNSSFLDLEEIESLSKAIAYMVDLSEKWNGVNKEYTEVVFSTKDDFQIGFFQQGTKTTAFSSSGYISKASCFFSSTGDLGSIKVMVDKGMTLLSQK